MAKLPLDRNPEIAVIDDDPDILELVSSYLKKSNFKVRGFSNGKDFLESLKATTPDLVILDLMLPDADGYEICKYLKAREDYSSIPIIMLTARVEETDKILGLELGADDYITKPFSPREVVARVKSVLRRSTTKVPTRKIEIGDVLVIDLQKYEVAVDGKKIDLTSTEFRILKTLAEYKGWVFTRDQILKMLWGGDKDVIDRTVDVHIKHLREKLGKVGQFIKNVRGIGYKLDV